MAAFSISKGKNNFYKNVKTFFSYYYHTFGEIPSLNNEVLEALIYNTLKNLREDVKWIQGAQEPWDICLTNINKKIQIKGSKIDSKDLHLFSFRLSKDTAHKNSHKDKIKALKTKIKELLAQTDVWYIVTREQSKQDPNKIKVSLFECNKNSFIFDKSCYNFKQVKKRTKISYQCLSNDIETGIVPNMGHILWYKLPFDKFKKMRGVKEAFSFNINIDKLPKVINL